MDDQAVAMPSQFEVQSLDEPAYGAVALIEPYADMDGAKEAVLDHVRESAGKQHDVAGSLRADDMHWDVSLDGLVLRGYVLVSELLERASSE